MIYSFGGFDCQGVSILLPFYHMLQLTEIIFNFDKKVIQQKLHSTFIPQFTFTPLFIFLIYLILTNHILRLFYHVESIKRSIYLLDVLKYLKLFI